MPSLGGKGSAMKPGVAVCLSRLAMVQTSIYSRSREQMAKECICGEP